MRRGSLQRRDACQFKSVPGELTFRFLVNIKTSRKVATFCPVVAGLLTGESHVIRIILSSGWDCTSGG
jgi:hypothetical protein